MICNKTLFALLFVLMIILSCSVELMKLTVKPSSADFGIVNRGESLDIKLTLKNKFDSDIKISGLDIDGSTDYQIKDVVITPLDILKDAEYFLTITFTPSTNGQIDALLLIEHTGSTEVKSVKLTGIGNPIAIMELSETSYDFQLSDTRITHSHDFEITNIGTLDLEISDMTFTDTGAIAYSITSGDAPVNIAPNDKHTFTVTFAPTQDITYPTDLSISHNAVKISKPFLLHIDGEGIILNPLIKLSVGPTLDIGTAPITFPVLRKIRIDNIGTDPLKLTSAIFANSTNFSVHSLNDSNGNDINFPYYVAVNDHVLLYIQFAPANKTTYNDTLSIEHDGNNETSPYDISLSGTGRDGLTKTFTYSGNIEDWIVPNDIHNLRIESWGAQGGGPRGGKGARVRGDFFVTPGETLKIIVGENGHVTAQGDYGAGGGGGSYVYRNATDPLPMIVAGAGGGQVSGLNGSGASHTESTFSGSGNGSGDGGSNGNGGNGGSNLYKYSTGGGGAGWLTDGKDGVMVREPEGKGGKCPKNGSAGGIFTHSYTPWSTGDAGNGGFGGGGGMSDNSGAGGGGGGYNGGGGGNNYTGAIWGSGGGAGSYNGGMNQTGTSNINSGNGKIIITY